MKKTITLIMLITVIFTYSVQGQFQSSIYYRGELSNSPTWDGILMTYRLLGTPSWIITIQSDGDDPLSEFKFSDDATAWTNNWGSGSTVTLDALSTFYTNGANGNFNETNTMYYTFTWKDVFDMTNSSGFVMETSAYPVSVSSVNGPGDTEDNTTTTNDNSVEVEVAISAPKSTEELFYVRYTDDFWATSSLASVSFTGGASDTTGKAIIPAQAAETEISYYVFSTTVSNPTTDFDLMTIEYDNNGGSNYSYTVLPGTTQDGDWHSASTWAEGVPAADDDVIISHDVTVNTSAVEINNIIINDTASLEFSGGYNHIIHGSIIVNGDAIISNSSQINIEGLIITPNN